MNKEKLLNRRRTRRGYRIAKKGHGDASRPRLAVCKSLKHISAQIIDDVQGKTLLAVSTLDENMAKVAGYGGNKAAATVIGKALADKAIAAGIKKVQFDRGHSRYHGRVASLADAARAAGLEF